MRLPCVLLHRYKSISVLDNSDNGDVVLWYESNRAMILSSTGSAQMLSAERGLQPSGSSVSDDGNFVFFNTAQTPTNWKTFFSYKDEKDQWTIPQVFSFGEKLPNQTITAINSDASILASGKHILRREKDQFTVIRSFDLTYYMTNSIQMTNDGKTLYLTVTNDPYNYKADDPPPQLWELVKITWTDDDYKPSIQVIESANDIHFRMLNDGARVIWNSHTWTGKVNQWNQLDQ